VTEIKIFGGTKESFVGMFLAFLLPLGLNGVSLADAGSEYQWPEWAKEIGLDIPGPYESTWESLDSHPISEWFRDAKVIWPISLSEAVTGGRSGSFEGWAPVG